MNVVADIAQLLDLVRIALRINITLIVDNRVREVEEVQRALVRAHISLVQHVHTYHLALHSWLVDILLFGIDNEVVSPTARHERHDG